MNGLVGYSSSSEDEDENHKVDDQPLNEIPTNVSDIEPTTKPSIQTIPEQEKPKMVGVAMPPPEFVNDSSSPEPEPDAAVIPTDLTAAEERALLLQLSSPSELPEIPGLPEPASFDEAPSATTLLLAQFGKLKSPSLTENTVIHFNQRIAANTELSRPGWLAQQAKFMGVTNVHQSDYLPSTITELPSKQYILDAYYNSRANRTKIDFTS